MGLVDTNNVDAVFSYHKPAEGQPEKYEAIRTAGKSFTNTILMNCEPCADRTAAIRKVREAVMTANVSIALGGQI